jgi:ATP-dependent helicase HrpB
MNSYRGRACVGRSLTESLNKDRLEGENYLLANGHGAQVDSLSSLSQNEFLVVVDLMKGRNSDSKIHFACPLDSLPEQLIKQGVFFIETTKKGSL